MNAESYEALKQQYLSALGSTVMGEAGAVERLDDLRQRLREFCLADGRDLEELERWFVEQLEGWAGYGGA